MKRRETLQDVTVRFAGDSGDGIQLMGSEFTRSTAAARNDMGTLPDYPAEIRAPAGTLAGVSGFQIHFGSYELYTPGDECDVLVVMNAAALKKNIPFLKRGAMIVANTEGFDAKNLRLSGYPADADPLSDPALQEYKIISIPFSKRTSEALAHLDLGRKEKERSKNMYVLGLICWLFSRPLDPIEHFLASKFNTKPLILDANLACLHAGYNFGETAELFAVRYSVDEAHLPTGTYREVTGNAATALGLVTAAYKAGLQLFYGSYPITPASDILHELASMKSFRAITFQAEDEIAAASAAIGASYAGNMAVTASSGPGIDLKGEAIGLALMLELPLVIVDVQRAGPSTGMPTKTEQSDLLLAMYGRHGEAPLPIVAPRSPSDCFYAAYMACKIAQEHVVPVFFLSDAFLANGAEPWRFPNSNHLPEIKLNLAQEGEYLPYQRDEKLARWLAPPGTPLMQHRVGGLEKDAPSGNISYHGANHERMVAIRAEKVAKVKDYLPPATLDSGTTNDKILVVGWGSTYGAIKTACIRLVKQGFTLAHYHIDWLNPLPHGTRELLLQFDKVVVVENNSGQLKMMLRAQFLIDALGINKIQGQPFTASELETSLKEHLA